MDNAAMPIINRTIGMVQAHAMGLAAPAVEETDASGLGTITPHHGVLDFAPLLNARFPCASPGWLVSGPPPVSALHQIVEHWSVVATTINPGAVGSYNVTVYKLPDGSVIYAVISQSYESLLLATYVYSCSPQASQGKRQNAAPHGVRPA